MIIIKFHIVNLFKFLIFNFMHKLLTKNDCQHVSCAFSTAFSLDLGSFLKYLNFNESTAQEFFRQSFPQISHFIGFKVYQKLKKIK